MTVDAAPLDRTTAIGVAETYLQGGLIAHDPDAPRLSASCWRQENGWYTGDTGTIRDHFPAMTMCLGIRDERWLVELPWVAVRYGLLLDEEFGGSKPVFEFFVVGSGAIEEISAVFPMRRWMHNALGPASDEQRAARPTGPRHPAEAETAAVANRFAADLVAGRKPLWGQDVSLTVNGTRTARGEDAVAEALRSAPWSSGGAIRTQMWVAEGYEAMGRLELEDATGEIVAWAMYLRHYGGLVRELDVVWGPGPGPALVRQWREEH